MDGKSLNIVLPCYNPQPGWHEGVCTSIQEVRSLHKGTVSLSIVNDGSTQNVSDQEVEHIKSVIGDFRYIKLDQNRGKGNALREGVVQAEEDIIVYTDIDFPYTLESLMKIAESIDKGADVALGFRKQNYYDKVPPFRKALSKFLRWVLRNVMRLKVTDTQCGLKGFNQTGKQTFLKTKVRRFLVDLEFVQLASKNKEHKVDVVDVQLKEGIIFTKVSPRVLFAESFNFIRLFFKGLF